MDYKRRRTTGQDCSRCRVRRHFGRCHRDRVRLVTGGGLEPLTIFLPAISSSRLRRRGESCSTTIPVSALVALPPGPAH